MKEEVKKVVELAKEIIQSEHTYVEVRRDEQRGDRVAIRFPVANPEDPTMYRPSHMFRNLAGEPMEISYARRLMTRDIGLNDAMRQYTHPEILEKIDQASEIAKSVMGKELDPVMSFDRAREGIYTVEVEIFRIAKAHQFERDDATWQASRGNPEGVMKIDARGHYHKLATMTVPDLYQPSRTLEEVFVQGQNESGKWRFGNSISTGDVFKLNGMAYVVAPIGYKELPDFKGVVPEIKRNLVAPSGPSM